MDEDFDLWTLKRWQPDAEESFSPDDAYTTNAPRVLAQKIIAFISGTELIIRSPNDDATEDQEAVNDVAEALAIGLLGESDRRLKRRGHPSVKESLAWYTVVRGRWAAARSLLRKSETGETKVDILPLDPRHLIVEMGDEEPLWAAYRMSRKRADLIREFPSLRFEGSGDDDDAEEVFEYFKAVQNPDFSRLADNPFDRRPFIYRVATIVDNQIVRPMRDAFTFSFPVVVVPVDSQPMLTPIQQDESELQDTFGESVFAENRRIWDLMNRATSYTIDLMAKASDPRKKVASADGTTSLEEGSSEKGAEINLSLGNQEDVELFEEADVNRAAQLMLQIVQNDQVAGALPPQAFGLLDKPLSSVALRQLGNNLEHRVMPRMRAVADCVEMSLTNMLKQYESQGFEPIQVSGKSVSGRRFASKTVTPDQIQGHDPLSVSMQLALPEDLSTTWAVAQQAVAPTGPGGESLASMEWVRENILRLPSHKVIRNQNLETLARSSDPLAQIFELFQMARQEGDEALQRILFDRLRVTAMQRQVEGSALLQQLGQLAQGLPIDTSILDFATNGNGNSNNVRLNRQSANPQNGGPGVAQQAGMGNQPAEDAGFNTTASRGGEESIEDRLNQAGLVLGR